MIKEYKKYIGTGEDNLGFTMVEERAFSNDMKQMLNVDLEVKNIEGEEIILEDVWEYNWERV